VPLARDQHQIVRSRLADGSGDGGTAIVDDARRMALDAAQDGASDGLRIFGARIVVGDDDPIRESVGDRTHQRAFARITVAAAAEDDP
jgi:hypothetical protein